MWVAQKLPKEKKAPPSELSPTRKLWCCLVLLLLFSSLWALLLKRDGHSLPSQALPCRPVFFNRHLQLHFPPGILQEGNRRRCPTTGARIL